MRALPWILVTLASLTIGGTVLARTDVASPAPTEPLRGSACLDPSQARGWAQIDNDTVLVDAGRNRYRVELARSCSALEWTNAISFRGDPVAGRVCGGLSDAVLTRDYPCDILSMSLISKAEYDQAIKDRDAERKARKEARAAAKAAKSKTP